MAVDWTQWPSDPTYAQDGSWDWRAPWVTPSRPGTIRWAAKQTVAPTVEPIDLFTAKLHLRVDTDEDDLLILNLIAAAREYCELKTNLALLMQTWVLQLDRFPRMDRLELWPATTNVLGAILLPRGPVQSVSSITWTDANGSVTTVSPTTYTTDLLSKPARIALTSTSSWPSSSSPGMAVMAGVQVTFVAGYTSASLVPANIRQAMLLMIGHWYINREEVAVDNRLVAIEIPATADTLLGLVTPPLVG